MSEQGEASLRAPQPGPLGRLVPSVELQWTDGAFVSLRRLAERSALVVLFLRGAEAEGSRFAELAAEEEARAVAWAIRETDLSRLGYRLLGVSAQSPIVQTQFASREPLQFMLLSDPDLELAEQLDLPTGGPDWRPTYDPLTLVVRDARVCDVVRPVAGAHDVATVMELIDRRQRQL